MKKKKSNPYDTEYVMKRDGCSYDEAMNTIQLMKDKNAWNKGKKLTSRANPYDPEYVMKRDGCSYDEAMNTIAEFKSSKATNLKNFIKKYGNTKGIKLYNEWKDKSLGIGHGVAKENRASQSKFSPSYYVRHGYNEQEAVEMALKFQHENSPLHIEYYIKRGKSIDYAKEKIRKIHDKKKGRDCYREFLEGYGHDKETVDEMLRRSRGHCSRDVLGNDVFEERIAKTRKTFEDKGLWIPLDQLSEYKMYRKLVWYYTNLNNLSELPNFEKRGLAGNEGAYHLDHRYSISEGFMNNVPAELIGSIKNLEFKPWKDNVAKQGNSDITIQELSNES